MAGLDPAIHFLAAKKEVVDAPRKGGPDRGQSLHVKRRDAHRLAAGIGGDLLDAGLGLAQQFLAAALERLAALVDRHRFLERNLALFEPFDDRFELLDRLLEE